MSSSISSPGSVAVGAQRTALVVDDVDDILDLLEIALGSAGFSVLRASSASEAIDVFNARQDEIDLLMTDVRVGIDSGFDLAERLLESKPSLEVLTMSGLAWDRRLSNRGGRIHFLPKPFSTSDLKNKLKTMFQEHPAHITVTVSAGRSGGFQLSTRVSDGTSPTSPPSV